MQHAIEAHAGGPEVTVGINVAELAHVRALVRHHLETYRALDGLDIDPSAPPKGIAFAIVTRTPRLQVYSHRDHSNWRRCSYCERERQFADGNIVLCADGKLRLIGDDCWRQHIMEEDWRVAQEEHGLYKRRVRFETMMERYAPASQALQHDLKDRSRWTASIQFVASLPALLHRRLPELYESLLAAVRTDGWLKVERYEVNFGSMEGRSGQRAAQELDDTPKRYRAAAVPIYMLAGGGALSPPPDLAALLDKAFARICQANHLLSTTQWDDLSDRAFGAKAGEYEELCRSALGLVEIVIQSARDTATFLGARNVTGILGWATDTDNEISYIGEWKAAARGIKLRTGIGDDAVALPEGFVIPDLPGSAQLRAAMGA